MRSLRAALIGVALVVSLPLAAQEGPRDIRPLIGTTIYSSDGADIGTVADVSFDESGRLAAVRIEAGARLGFGTRKVQLPGNVFTKVRGNLVAGIPKEAVEALPTLDTSRSGPSAEE